MDQSIRILVVDDNPDILANVRRRSRIWSWT